MLNQIGLITVLFAVISVNTYLVVYSTRAIPEEKKLIICELEGTNLKVMSKDYVLLGSTVSIDSYMFKVKDCK